MKKKILLIEDEELIRDLYQEELTKNDFEVSAFGTAEEGLTALAQDHFDIVLLDIMLPGINGLAMLKQIKSKPETKDLKVILLTNLGQEEVIKEGFSLGATGYLIKAAYNPDQIIQEVKNFIENNKPAVT